ncbi:fimbria/pilus outer membrane usher protein [Dyella japonica]|uniref:Outer membrane usher protein n=1 Tax=Dyella japonica TaxID=231455 RepID=A0ABV2K0W3_9GAMM
MSLRPAKPKSRNAFECPRPHLLGLLIAALLAGRAHAAAPSADPSNGVVGFDAGFFPSGMAPKVDLSRFEKSGYVAPGVYRGDITVNKQWRAHDDIVYASVPGADNSQPCFDAAALKRYGIDLQKVIADLAANPAKKPLPDGKFCGTLGDYIPGATVDFDAATQSLSLSVPQIYLQRSARGYVDPSQWDPGINAVVVGYNANAYSTQNHGSTQTTGYLGLNASLNLGSWHAYQLSSLSVSGDGHSHYQNASTYAQHDILSWRAQMVVGDTFTPGDLFDSVRVRGARVYSDDRMLPQSLRGYAPIVHGLADTNAKVTIRQRGYVIYEANVAPGPFVIDDLYPTGYGGDLSVVVTEADGRIKEFSVPYSAVTQSLRPGLSRWSITAGKVDELNFIDQPRVVQGTYQRGLTNLITAYGGATLATGYRAALIGSAFNTDIGAFSADITQARNSTPGQSASQGISARLGYNKNIIDTGTNFAVSAYRYSTSGYVDLQSAVAMRDAAARGFGPNFVQRDKSRLDLSVNQTLGSHAGQLFITGSARNFWNYRGRQVDFSAGYSNQWRDISYSLSAQRTRDSVQQSTVGGLLNSIPGQTTGLLPNNSLTQRDTRIFFSMTMPLSKAAHSPTLNALYSHSQQAGANEQMSLSGTAGDSNRFNYGASLSHGDGNSAVSLNGQYNASFARFAGGFNDGTGYRQLGGGMSGGVVFHRDGATWGPPLGDTVGLVYAPGARGATVQNSQGATVDTNGYALVPYLTPYELNTITLDPKGAGAGVTFKSTSHDIAPRAGTVVRVNYDTVSGRALIIDTALHDGRPVPFGAEVFDEQGNNIGVAGQAGRLFVNGLTQSGVVTVRWSDDPADSCRIQVNLPRKPAKSDDYENLQAPCQPGGISAAPTDQAPSHTSALWHRQSPLRAYGGTAFFPSIALGGPEPRVRGAS